jgi:hypothetical protein
MKDRWKFFECKRCSNYCRSDRFNKEEGHCKKECQPYLSQEALNQVPTEPMEVELRDDQEPLEVKEDDLQQLPQVVFNIDTATNLTSVSRVLLDSEEGFRTLLKDIEDNKKE